MSRTSSSLPRPAHEIRCALRAFLFVAALTILATVPILAIGQTPVRADSILILKKAHVLELLSNGRVIRTYKVALGSGGLAPKERKGDARTPEGHYVVDSRNVHSAYHKALHISYPDADDRRRAAKLGVPAGGEIMIHGLPNGMGWLGAAHRSYDWTLGCVAVTDSEIDEIWNLVPLGTPVEIRP